MLQSDHPLWSILQELVSYVPALMALLMITREFDTEWVVVWALLGGASGRKVLEHLERTSKDKQA